MPGPQVVVAMVTPFSNGGIDRGAVSWLASRLSESGVTGVFVPGTTGEWPLLTPEERAEAFFSVASSAIGGLRLIAGVSSLRPEESYRLAEEAASHGAHAVMATPPFYYRPTPSFLAEFYRGLKRASGGLPTMMYLIPSNLGFTLEVSVVESLVAAGVVDGIKATVYDYSYILGLASVKDRHPEFEVLAGGLEMLAPTLLAGGDGAVDAFANVLPGLAVSIVEAIEEGELARLGELQRRARRLAGLFRGYQTPPALKALLSRLGAPVKPESREPLESLGERDAETLVKAVCEGYSEFLLPGLRCP
ncbi:MAG: dihydrodipicolinate synthase family protein [Aeropyrum sp.]|nr:dihydrodipicolinate synthase family protein [Aeropyrum sp.]